MAHPQPQGDLLKDFINGARRAVDINLYTQIPNFCMAFGLIRILDVTGIMGLLGRLLGPVMGIFGLPGEAAALIAASWLSSSAGVGATVAMAQAGVLTGTQIVILAPMMRCIGGQIQLMGRILAVAQTPTKYYPVICTIGFLNAIFAGLVMRILV